MRRFVFLLCGAFLVVLPAHSQTQTLPSPGPPGKPLPPATERAQPTTTPEPHFTFSWIHVDEPYVALTFDDGPHKTLTPKLLDLLAQRHIKATFFVLGECVAENRDILQRAAREGHEIGSHSWSHPQLNKMSDEAVRSQLRRTDDIIKETIGKRPTLFRPPYGAITARQKKWIHDEFGYDIILWDVDPLDWKDPGPTTVSNRILRETRAGSIILSHDIHAGTITAMPETIDQLEAKRFKFVTVSELISLATPEPPKPSPAEKKRMHASSSPAPAGSASPSSASPVVQKPATPAPSPPGG